MAIDLLGKGKKTGKGSATEEVAKPVSAASEPSAKPDKLAGIKSKVSELREKLNKAKTANKGVKGQEKAPEKIKIDSKALKGFLTSNLKEGIKAFPRGATEVLLRTDLENGKSLIWKMTDTSLEQSTASKGDLVASFGLNDIRIPTEPKDGFQKVAKLLNVEADTKTYPISRVKDQMAAYGSPVSRIDEAEYRMGPAQQALEALVAEKLADEDKENPSPVIYGVHLKDSSSGTSLTILYFKDTLGGTSKPQIVINSDNPEFVLGQFITSKKLPKNQVKALWFSNSELISKIYEVLLYPNEAVFNGIPVRRLMWMGAVASVAASVGSLGWMSLEVTRNQILKISSAKATEKTKQLITQNSNNIAAGLTDFGKVMSIDVSKIVTNASKSYMRGTLMSLQADGTSTNITLKMEMKILGTNMLPNRSPLKSREISELKALIGLEAPEGCSKNDLKINGELNEAEITINCPSSDTRLSGYRGQ